MTDRPDAAKVRECASVLANPRAYPDLAAWRRAQAADLVTFFANALEGKGDWQVESAEVIRFLKGAAPLDGVWFGEPHPTEKGAFWWRKQLAAAKERDDE